MIRVETARGQLEGTAHTEKEARDHALLLRREFGGRFRLVREQGAARTLVEEVP